AMMMRVWRPTGAEAVKFICLVPGYDRHFTICEHFDMEMIALPFLPTGPDMARIETLVQSDPAIKGIWCVPKYSNSTGHSYDDKTVTALAALASKAGDDFRVLWDNAYTVHHLTDKTETLADVLGLAAKAGCPDSIAMFASTSKITHAGSGISFFAGSEANLAAFEKFLSAQVICFDKVNQLRHVRFLRDSAGIAAQMAKHRAILQPKFALVEQKLNQALAGKDIASWTKPTGGYFVSLDTRPGLASRVVALAAEAGVKLTPAGATFPQGKDPEDRNIRIAPTYPSLAELDKAMDVLVTCIELASAEQTSN
ncbi:MAG: aminotransferase, partial [Pseudomonadales bacterium]